MAEYAPPAWGEDGANAFGIFLEVVKGGVVLERVALPVTPGRSCAVAGRLPPPACDLELAHGSASRVHAALQFDAQGALFLADLGSTHGSFVNKRRAPPKEFVRLHIGDVLAFGESSRLYAVCGPEELLPAEYDSLNLRALRDKSAQRQEKKATQRREQQTRDDGASWGFREDAVDDDEDDDEGGGRSEDDENEKLPDYLRNLKSDDAPYASSVKQSELNAKDQKLFQQLQARISKMENLKLETARIEAKQNQLPGLSEGQEQTLARNAQRVQALRKEIEDIEGRIHAKNAQRATTQSRAEAAGRAGRRRQAANGDESDDDDFYDRTQSNQRRLQERKQHLGDATAGAKTSSGDGALTAEAIAKAIKSLESELREVVREQDAVSARSTAGAQQQEEGEDADSLDSFMASTTTQLHATQAAAIGTRRQELEAELRRQQQLLAIATPALARVATHALSAKAPKQAAPTQSPAASDAALPPAVLTNSATPEELTADGASGAKASEAPAPVKRPAASQKIESNEAPEPAERRAAAASAASSKPPDANQAKKRKVAGPALGPPPTGGARGSSSAARNGADAAVRGESNELEGGERVWVPPAGQTGDGRTKLNDKFGY